MVYKSSIQPLCRYCGGKIAKYTRSKSWWPHADAPLSREEAERMVNQELVSIRYDTTPSYVEASPHPRKNADGSLTEPLPGNTRYVRSISTWDGESYVDEFFCNGDHAKAFGYVCARDGRVTGDRS